MQNTHTHTHNLTEVRKQTNRQEIMDPPPVCNPLLCLDFGAAAAAAAEHKTQIHSRNTVWNQTDLRRSRTSNLLLVSGMMAQTDTVMAQQQKKREVAAGSGRKTGVENQHKTVANVVWFLKT